MTAATFQRRTRPLWVSLILAVAVLARTAAALAEEPSAASALAASERAYQEVDFATMHDEAARAVQAGRATREETARCYVLLGISSAALARDDEAKKAFIVALAVDPTLKLDRTLSPKVREPYLEAQGYWGAYTERLALRGRAAEDGEHLTVGLTDPGRLATKIGFYVRTLGSKAFETQMVDAAHVVRFQLPRDARSRGYEYFASVMDEHQNVLAELGSEGDPRVTHGAPRDRPAERPAAEAHPPKQRSYLLPIALGAGGLAATAVGVVFHLERESAAREWNGPGCEHSGASRIEQCGDVDSRRRLDETLAIGGYAAAGLLFTGGVVALLVGRNPSLERQPHSAHAGLVGCGLAGTALSCAGAF